MKRAAVVAALGTTLLSAGLAPALAGVSHPAKAKVFASTLKPNKNVKKGQTLVLKSTKAAKSTSYDCVLVVLHKGDYAADYNSISGVKSNSKGHVTCKESFAPFTATDQKGTTRHCPTTKSDRKAGFSCAVSLADVATQGQKSASVAYFTAK